MSKTESLTGQGTSSAPGSMGIAAILALALVAPFTQAGAQGTMTIGFQSGPGVPPPGYRYAEAAYSESGVQFWNPYGPDNLVLAGGSVAGYPENGSGYLQVPAGADLGFSFNTFPGTYFNLVSFDAAGYSTNLPGPSSLEVVGYKGMAGTVTNFFTVDSLLARRAGDLPDFQTFYLDSQFHNVFRVDVITGGWSVDNIVIGGVPEPSSGALIALGAVCGIFRTWTRSRKER